MWKGDYPTWYDAQQQCKGYNAMPILEKCLDAMMRVQAGQAAYERDSILYYERSYSWDILSLILKIAYQTDFKVHIMDFGGSLGSVYFKNKRFLDELPFKELTWNIIEQPHFVECGKQYIENDVLKFYSSINELEAIRKPDIILAAGIISYVEKPDVILEEFKSLQPSYIVLDRVPIVEYERDIISVQNVYPSIYEGSYPCRFFNEKNFTSYCSPYTIESVNPSYDNSVWLNGYPTVFKGFVLKKN